MYSLFLCLSLDEIVRLVPKLKPGFPECIEDVQDPYGGKSNRSCSWKEGGGVVGLECPPASFGDAAVQYPFPSNSCLTFYHDLYFQGERIGGGWLFGS